MSQQSNVNVNQHGFVHNLSPVKRSRKNNYEWYDFELQTSPTKVRRVVGFNIPAHQNLQHFQDSKTPVLLKNLFNKDVNDDWMFNQQSLLFQAPNSDISFHYMEQPKASTASPFKPSAVDITISEITTLKPNQKVNVSGTLSVGSKEPKQVLVKSTQENSFVKEDYVIEDSTGTSMLHIWDPLIKQLEDGKTYTLKNLTVKNYQGATFLSSSPNTTFIETTRTLTSLNGPQILQAPDQLITVENFKFINKLAIFVSCQLCKKRINNISSKSIKCHNCGARQRSENSRREGSVKLCVSHNNNDLWLTAFTEELKKLLSIAPSVTLENKADEIEDALIEINDITLLYNIQTSVITDVLPFIKDQEDVETSVLADALPLVKDQVPDNETSV